MAEMICTRCGYEGRGTRRTSSGGGWAARMLGLAFLLPVHTVWKLVGSRRTKNCPHCGMPSLVKRNSDEGWLAVRKMEVELGLAPVKEEVKLEAFGNEKPQVSVKKPVNPDEW